MKWTRGEYEIERYVGVGTERVKVTGAILADVFGVHRGGSRKTFYAVTHLPTARAASPPGGFARQATAKAYAERLLPLTDWQTVTARNIRMRIDRGLLFQIAEGLLNEEAA